MRLKTDALIIRENNNIGEADRFVTALTREWGVLRASARGARNMKSRSASATQLLAYSRLTLYPGRDKYIIDDAQPIRVFFELRSDIEKLALAQYFCELAGVLAPREEPAEEYLRLLLNALHYLGAGRPPAQLKTVVELRLLSLSGYMPDLEECHFCGGREGPLWLLPRQGVLACGRCPHGDGLPVPAAVLAAMRHIVSAPFERCFAFTMSGEELKTLAAVSETFCLNQLERGFKTLDFYHTISG